MAEYELQISYTATIAERNVTVYVDAESDDEAKDTVEAWDELDLADYIDTDVNLIESVDIDVEKVKRQK